MSKPIACLVVDDEPIARDILEAHLLKVENVQIVALCKNAVEAFQWLNKQRIDLIFLDINMPEITGLSFAKSISKDVKIIFTTAYREYAVDGFDLRAVDYLLKPISFERLMQSIQKYLDENVSLPIEEEETATIDRKDYFFVRSERKMVKVKLTEILYIESLSDYVRIHTDNAKIITRETISNIEAKLPAEDFLRVHRSFIVAVSRIESYTHEYIEIKDSEVPLSRGYKNDVLKFLESYG